MEALAAAAGNRSAPQDRKALGESEEAGGNRWPPGKTVRVESAAAMANR